MELGDRRRRGLCSVAAGLALRVRAGGTARGPVDTPRPFAKVDAATGLAMVIKLDAVRVGAGGGPHPAEGDLLARAGSVPLGPRHPVDAQRRGARSWRGRRTWS